MTQPTPRSVRSARFPAEYGKPGGADDLLPWSFVEDRLVASPVYWLATVTQGSLPHVRPIDGVWVDGALCFGGGSETRWVRNLQKNTAVAVHIGGAAEAIILEGTAVQITDAAHPLARPVAETNLRKYPQYYPEGKLPPFQPFWALRPARVYAWTLEGFPRTATRWDFEAPDRSAGA